MIPYKSRRGFSVVDLLAVVAGGGVVLALLLPAAQRTREAARMVDCKDRLWAIAKATHDFHDAFMRLPPGTLNYESPPDGLEAAKATPGFSQNECQNLSALFLILPFMTLSDDLNAKQIYSSVDKRLVDLHKDLRQIVDTSDPPARVFNGQYRYGPGASPKNFTDSCIAALCDADMGPSGIATQSIPNFNCPADDLNVESELPSIGISMPYYNAVSLYGTPLDNVLYVVFKDLELGKTNYVAVAGTTSCINVPSPLAKWGGAMTGRTVMTLEQISNLDGTSRTFMYGESLGDVGSIVRVGDTGAIVGNAGDETQPGKRAITRAWIWGGIGILASYNFPWGTMQHPTIHDPRVKGRFLKLLGDGHLADPESFSSVHKAGVNFAMADASVHTIPRGITWQLYYGNGGLRDGATERGF